MIDEPVVLVSMRVADLDTRVPLAAGSILTDRCQRCEAPIVLSPRSLDLLEAARPDRVTVICLQCFAPTRASLSATDHLKVD
jgi:RNase P subunit RPR2